MTAAVASRLEDLTLELQGLVLVRALSSSGGCSDESIAERGRRARRRSAELERVGG